MANPKWQERCLKQLGRRAALRHLLGLASVCLAGGVLLQVII